MSGQPLTLRPRMFVLRGQHSYVHVAEGIICSDGVVMIKGLWDREPQCWSSLTEMRQRYSEEEFPMQLFDNGVIV